jgi:bifunctional DNA-binding transcriptional regulator/antitoxin component of YhaV-PrlF toxin-antitoxin module
VPVLAKTRIGKYFRTTVPREVRKILEIKENDVVEWVLERDKIIVRKGKNESKQKHYGGKE